MTTTRTPAPLATPADGTTEITSFTRNQRATADCANCGERIITGLYDGARGWNHCDTAAFECEVQA